MTEKHAAESNKAEADSSANHGKDMKFLQAFTLIALFLFWIGYVAALYKGNDSKMSGYSLLIVAFSLVNFNALCGITKIENYYRSFSPLKMMCIIFSFLCCYTYVF